MERTFNTYKSTSEKILIESVDKETGITTSITVEPEAYAVLAEYFKQCAVAESSDENSGLHKHAVIKSLPDIDLDKAEALAISTDYATFAVGEDVNTADAGAFFLEGYMYAQRQLGNVF